MATTSQAEKKFEAYRESLVREVRLLADYVEVLRRLHKLKNDYRFESGWAPAFFSIVKSSLSSSCIIWANKLLDERGQRGIFNFLRFVADNVNLFSIEELQRRKRFTDSHRVIVSRRKKGGITKRRVELEHARLRRLRCLSALKVRRDKYYGHFDRKYFFDLALLEREAALSMRDLRAVVRALSRVISKYSVAYDAHEYIEFTSSNVGDVEHVLQCMRDYHQRQSDAYVD